MNMNDKIRIANRVDQLEANYLDREFDSIVDESINSIGTSEISEEFKLAVKLFVQLNQIKNGSTIGGQVYNCQIHDSSILNNDSISDQIKTPFRSKFLILFNLIMPYFSKRQKYVEQFLSHGPIGRLKFQWLNFESLSNVARLISLLNFLAFLRSGRYLLVQERLMGLIPMISESDERNNSSINKVQMEFMHREVVWAAISDFLVTIIPLVNLSRVKSRLTKALNLTRVTEKQTDLYNRTLKRETAKCCLCQQQPFNPYEIGCRHIFCYYCLYSHNMLDPTGGFCCTVCKFSTHNPDDVKRYTARFEL